MTARRRALVLGYGRFGGGREAARFLLRRGWDLRVADRATSARLNHPEADLRGDVDWWLGRDGLDDAPSALDGIDLLVANPAIPDDHPFLAAARHRSIPITQEVTLFLKHYPGRVVVVTGTDGKSSTCRLLASALQSAGADVLLGGNIGHSLLAEEERWNDAQIAVLEVSSFQLARLDPACVASGWEGAVLTPIGRDHLDRHGSLAAYRAAKEVAARGARSFLVHGADDAVASGFSSRARRYRWSARDREVDGHLDDGWLVACGHALCRTRALSMAGDFQAHNALAAGLAALCCGAAPHGVGLGLAVAPPLPHRLQRLPPIGPVAVWDNGVSTAAASTASAVATLARSFEVHWIGGGIDKGDGAEPVAAAVAPHVASAHGFGARGSDLRTALASGGTTATAHDDLRDAADAALAAAVRARAEGRTHRPPCLLFSPGFASFDQYANFAARAADFRTWAAGARDAAARHGRLPTRTEGGAESSSAGG